MPLETLVYVSTPVRTFDGSDAHEEMGTRKTLMIDVVPYEAQLTVTCDAKADVEVGDWIEIPPGTEL